MEYGKKGMIFLYVKFAVKEYRATQEEEEEVVVKYSI